MYAGKINEVKVPIKMYSVTSKSNYIFCTSLQVKVKVSQKLLK